MSLHLQAVAKRYGGITVFENLDMVVRSGQKVALIGANGSGKTTLLRLIAGLEQPDGGTISVEGTVSLLEQVPEFGDEPVMVAVMPPELRNAAADLSSSQDALADPSAENLQWFAAAEERYRVLGGYDFAARAEATLAGLDLDGHMRVGQLSGGQQRRVQLARQLLAPGDVLLLDEPTNHLDAAGLAWLEGWLQASLATVVLVSHDRAFLDATVSSVAELERGQLSLWPGNYTEAMAVKATANAAQQRLHDAQAREKRKLEVEVGRLGSAGRSAASFNHRRAGNQALILAKSKAESVSRTLASRARAMQKRLERFEVTPEPFDDHDAPVVPLPEVPFGPSEVVRLEGVTLERGGRTLARDLNVTLRRGEKLALLGPNGSGKSSLLQLILGRLAPSSGRVLLGSNLEPFSAGQRGEELGGFATLEDALRAAQPALRRQDLYYLLARLGLPTDPTFRVLDLSGGQRTRLALARLAVTRAALLVLDEPNNHLDVRMIEALETLLVAYQGTLLFASHDRRLVRSVASRTLTLGDEGHTVGDVP